MSVWVIVNPVAGAARRRSGPAAAAAVVADVCGRHGLAATVEVTTGAGHATALAARAVAAGGELVVAWGGDGTVNEIAQALVGHECALGLVPVGSGNGLARALGAPADPAMALERSLTGRSVPIDIGMLGDRVFVNLAGLGLDAAIAERFARRHHQRRGFARYVSSAFRELATYRPDTYTVTWEGGRFTGPLMMVVVANGSQYGNGVIVAPQARPDDGRLDLVLVRPGPFWLDGWRALGVLRGRILDDPRVTIVQTAAVTIAGPDALRCHCDGEPGTASSPLEIRVRRSALRVRHPSPP